MIGIYKITSKVDNSLYVGSSVNIKGRFYYHTSALRRNTHDNRRFQELFNNTGIENFEFEIIEECEKSDLIEREQYYINQLKPTINISPTAGVNRGVKLSDETRNKMSAVRKGVKKSEETRRKMSMAQMGNTKGKNSRKKMYEKRKTLNEGQAK